MSQIDFSPFSQLMLLRVPRKAKSVGKAPPCLLTCKAKRSAPPALPSTKNIVWPLLDVMPASCTDARERFPPPASHPCLSSLQISTVSVKGSLQKEPAASVLFFFSTSLERPDTKLEPMKRSPPQTKACCPSRSLGNGGMVEETVKCNCTCFLSVFYLTARALLF